MYKLIPLIMKKTIVLLFSFCCLTFFVQAENVVDKSGLSKEINIANNVLNSANIGTANGDYPQWAIKELKIAIEKSVPLLSDTTVEQYRIGYATDHLDSALTLFNTTKITPNSIDKSALASVIDTANSFINSASIGNQKGQYSQMAYDTFFYEIITAETIKYRYETTANDVDSATINLSNAISIFKKSVNSQNIIDKSPLIVNIYYAKSALDSAIIGDQSGQYPKWAAENLSNTITWAEYEVTNELATLEAIDSAIYSLKYAIYTLKQNRNPYTQDVNRLNLGDAIDLANYDRNIVVRSKIHPTIELDSLDAEIFKAMDIYSNYNSTDEELVNETNSFEYKIAMFELSALPGMKSTLRLKINTAITIIDSARIGTSIGEYPQWSVDALKAAISKSQTIVSDSTSDFFIIARTIIDVLDTAVNELNSSKVTDSLVSHLTIVITPSKVTLKKGNFLKLSYVISPLDSISYHPIWNSSDNSIANVDSDGVVTAFSTGTTTITCTIGSYRTYATTEATIIVTADTIIHYQDTTVITINPSKVSLIKGKSIKLSYNVSPVVEPRIEILKGHVTWNTSDFKVANIDSDGVVTAYSAGVAIITCTVGSNGVYAIASAKIIVTDSISDNISFVLHKLVIFPADTIKLTDLVKTSTISDVVLKTANSKIAFINDRGFLFAKSYGETTIYAMNKKDSTKRDSTHVLVLPNITILSAAVTASGTMIEIVVSGNYPLYDGIENDFVVISYLKAGTEIKVTNVMKKSGNPNVLLLQLDKPLTEKQTFTIGFAPTTTKNSTAKILSSFSLKETTGFDDVTIETNLYPNPAQTSITIDAEDLQTVTIINLQGQEMTSASASGNSVNLSIESLPEGIYVAEIITKSQNAKKSFVKR